MNKFLPTILVGSSLALASLPIQADPVCSHLTLKPPAPDQSLNDADLRLLNNCSGIADKFRIPSQITPAECYKSKSNVVAYLDGKKVNVKTVSRFISISPDYKFSIETVYHLSGGPNGKFSTIDTGSFLDPLHQENISIQPGTGTKDFAGVTGGGSDTYYPSGEVNDSRFAKTLTVTTLDLDLCLPQ
jgi:hypothetical protein